MKGTTLVVFLTLAAVAPAGALEAQHDLKFKAVEGEEFTYVTKLDLELQSPGFKMELKGKTVFAFKSLSSTSPYDIEGKIVRETIDLEFQIPMVGKISGKVDSSGEKPDPPENPMDFRRGILYGLHVKHAARVGKTFTVVVDEKKGIQRLRGIQNLLDTIKEVIDSDSAISPMMAPGLKRDLTPENFRQAIDGIFVALPEKPAKEGDVLERDYSRTMDDKSVLKLHEKLTLGAVEEGFADFSLEVRLQKNGQEIKPESDNPMEKILSGRAESYRDDTEGMLDISNGRVVFAAGEIEYKSVLKTENPINQEVRERKAKMKIKIEVEYAPGPPKKEEEK
ncbi:MAG: DUF6263 family protein [Planctomycetota bacterium]